MASCILGGAWVIGGHALAGGASPANRPTSDVRATRYDVRACTPDSEHDSSSTRDQNGYRVHEQDNGLRTRRNPSGTVVRPKKGLSELSTSTSNPPWVTHGTYLAPRDMSCHLLKPFFRGWLLTNPPWVTHGSALACEAVAV
jgi:hypothetical protein